MDEKTKIIEALETIRNVCKNTQRCEDCPFYARNSIND